MRGFGMHLFEYIHGFSNYVCCLKSLLTLVVRGVDFAHTFSLWKKGSEGPKFHDFSYSLWKSKQQYVGLNPCIPICDWQGTCTSDWKNPVHKLGMRGKILSACIFVSVMVHTIQLREFFQWKKRIKLRIVFNIFIIINIILLGMHSKNCRFFDILSKGVGEFNIKNKMS